MPYIGGTFLTKTVLKKLFRALKTSNKLSKSPNTINKKYSIMDPDGPLSTMPELDLDAVN